MEKKLEIIATPFDDSSLCRFTLSIGDLSEKGMTFKNPLKEDCFINDLFQLEGITEVFVEKNYIILKKNSTTPWNIIGKSVGESLRNSYKRSLIFIPSDLLEKEENEDSSADSVKQNKEVFNTELGKKVVKILDLSIKPLLSSHGGSVVPIDIKNGVLFVQFLGGCQGRSQVTVTVKDGIEKMITKDIPEIKEVRDITDHQMGVNPYYK